MTDQPPTGDRGVDLSPQQLDQIAHNLCSLHDFDPAFVVEQERFARAVIAEYLRAAPEQSTLIQTASGKDRMTVVSALAAMINGASQIRSMKFRGGCYGHHAEREADKRIIELDRAAHRLSDVLAAPAQPPAALDEAVGLLRLLPLLKTLTVRQVIEAGSWAIDAAGLDPWCINEGKATGDEQAIAGWRLDAARAFLANLEPSQ